ncbi:MAG: hypothetical protein JXA94_06275 [Parachlamydiales bacterium]|nr:hypothetical protein [Parachlamydiales bacterium]
MTDNNFNNLNVNRLDSTSKRHDLLIQELDINTQEQVLVNKRIFLLKEVMKEIPKTDPQYALLFTQLEMDRIELDELKNRHNYLKTALGNSSK